MKKVIYILLFALATTVSLSAYTADAPTQISKDEAPIGGLLSDPK